MMKLLLIIAALARTAHGQTWFFGDLDQDCNQVCETQGGTCTEGFWEVTNEDEMRARLTDAGQNPDDLCTGGYCGTGCSNGCESHFVLFCKQCLGGLNFLTRGF